MLNHLPQEQVQALVAFLIVFAIIGVIVTLAWSHIAPNEQTRRLRDVVSGNAGERARRREAAAKADVTPQAGLRSKPSELLSRILAMFRVSERINDGKTVQMLQQAGFRGRAMATKYIALRILSPMLLFGGSTLYVILILSKSQPMTIQLGVVLGATLLGYFLPHLLLKNRIDKRKIEIGRAWPDAVDLMLICVETGMSIEHAFKKVAEEMAANSIELAKEMSLTNAELSYLQERRQAYENMAKRIDLDTVQAVTSCLIQSEKYGTSLGVSLRVLAQESRELRMAAAEKKAAALPPKLTVPMIIFFLPVLFAVIITPAAIQIMTQ